MHNNNEAQEIEDRLDREVAATVERMQKKWPSAVDWNMIDENDVQILDVSDNVIAIITSSELDALYVDAGWLV